MKLVTAIVRPEKLDGLIDAVVDHKGRGLLRVRTGERDEDAI